MGSEWCLELELGKWSNASILMGSNFPSAIAMAIDEGISLVQLMVKENKWGYETGKPVR